MNIDWQPFNKDKFTIERGFIEKITDETHRELLPNILDFKSEEEISKQKAKVFVRNKMANLINIDNFSLEISPDMIRPTNS